jgi:hypothetical protein
LNILKTKNKINIYEYKKIIIETISYLRASAIKGIKGIGSKSLKSLKIIRVDSAEQLAGYNIKVLSENPITN